MTLCAAFSSRHGTGASTHAAPQGAPQDMTRHSFIAAAAGVLFAVTAPAAQAQVFKCRTPGGGITYAQAPCANAGLQDAGTVKVDAPPPAPLRAAPGPGMPAATGAAPANRPKPPPGVDDPLGDPQRPALCAEQQRSLDTTVADIRRLLAEEQKQTSEFETNERRIAEYNASPSGRKIPAIGGDNRYDIRNREKTEMTAKLGYERIRLQSLVQGAYSLKCGIIGKPLRLEEAERLRYPPTSRVGP